MNLICIKTTFFWDATPWSSRDGADVSEKSAAVIFWEEKQIIPKP
jgi:hypothetical protein